MNAIYLLFLNTGVRFVQNVRVHGLTELQGFAAPVAAGFIADSQGWHWIWWWSAIFLGVNLLAFMFLYEETKYTVTQVGSPSTNHPTVDTETSAFHAQHQDKTPSHPNSEALGRVATHDVDLTISKKPYLQRMALYSNTPSDFKQFFRHLYQPLLVLVTLPAVAYTAVQYGAALSWYSIIGTSNATYFPAAPYHFGNVGIGLLNLPPFIGCVLSALFAGPLSDWTIQKLARKNNGVYEPEMRLYLILIPTILVPLGIFMYGYSVAKVSTLLSFEHCQLPQNHTLISWPGRPLDHTMYW